METKLSVIWKTEKKIDNFYNKYREGKPCIIKRSTRRYYENKDKITNQQKLFYEMNRELLLFKSKIYQQNRKSHTQQINDLNNKIEQFIQAVETLFSKIE